MSIPLATTEYEVWRATNIDQDAGEELHFELHLSGVRGNTVYFSGSESVVGGDRERVDARVLCDPVDVRHFDRIYDQGTGDWWEVAYSRLRPGLGLDHRVCGVYAITGVAKGTRDL